MAAVGSAVKKTIAAAVLLLCLAIMLGVLALGYLFAERQVAARVYRERLAEMTGQYEQLRERYNRAISRTAVTELVVEDGALTVRVRDADGTVREIPTPYDPSGEIYVDFVVLDGRLWIRRVFDARTPPSEALVIEPELAHIDWTGDEPGGVGELRHGKAVYRALAEGRWMVTVTGNGALGLGPAPAESVLESLPAIERFDEVLEEADRTVKSIGPGEVLGSLFGRN